MTTEPPNGSRPRSNEVPLLGSSRFGDYSTVWTDQLIRIRRSREFVLSLWGFRLFLIAVSLTCLHAILSTNQLTDTSLEHLAVTWAVCQFISLFAPMNARFEAQARAERISPIRAVRRSSTLRFAPVAEMGNLAYREVAARESTLTLDNTSIAIQNPIVVVIEWFAGHEQPAKFRYATSIYAVDETGASRIYQLVVFESLTEKASREAAKKEAHRVARAMADGLSVDAVRTTISLFETRKEINVRLVAILIGMLCLIGSIVPLGSSMRWGWTGDELRRVMLALWVFGVLIQIVSYVWLARLRVATSNEFVQDIVNQLQVGDTEFPS